MRPPCAASAVYDVSTVPKPFIRYYYRFDFECPHCSAGMIYVFVVVERRREKLLEAPQRGRCSMCNRDSCIDARKAIRRTVEQRKNGTWSVLRILDSQGEWKSGPTA